MSQRSTSMFNTSPSTSSSSSRSLTDQLTSLSSGDLSERLLSEIQKPTKVLTDLRVFISDSKSILLSSNAECNNGVISPKSSRGIAKQKAALASGVVVSSSVGSRRKKRHEGKKENVDSNIVL